MKEISRWKAMWLGKCPKCRKSDVFKFKWFQFIHFNEMHIFCKNCNHKFEIEPGYFYSAMYISYMITTGLCLVSGFIIYSMLDDPDSWIYILLTIGLLIISSPLVFRISRMITLHYVTPVVFEPKEFISEP